MNYIIEHDNERCDIQPLVERRNNILVKYTKEIEDRMIVTNKKYKKYRLFYNFYLFVTGILALTISCLSFLSASNLIDDTRVISYVVGVLGAIVVFIHGYANGTKIQTKYNAFLIEFNDYKELLIDLEFRIYPSNEEMINDFRKKLTNIEKRNKFV